MTDSFDNEPWSPPASVTLHNGEPIPPDADFFRPPPAEIGELRSAQSTLVKSKQPVSLLARLLFAIGLPGALFFGIVSLFRTANPRDMDMVYILAIVIAAPVFIAVLYFTRFRHACTFVGSLGIAEYKLAGSRESTPHERLLLFEKCFDITTWQLSQYVNGIYSTTQYKTTFRDANFHTLFQLQGNYRSEQGTPKAKSPYWFAVAAEGAWNLYAFERLAGQLESEGHIDFRVNRKDHVRIGPGFLEFTFGGKTTRVTPDDIKSLTINSGTFAVHTHEARWFSSKGKFTFEYSGMGNAKLFLFALERLAGYTFG